MNDEKKFYIIMYAGWALAALFFVLSRIAVHSNGVGTTTVGTQLGQAQQSASTVAAGIGQAEQSAGEIRETAGKLQSIVTDIGEPIESSKQIIRGIRQRGKVETITH